MDYVFVPLREFKQKQRSGFFLEWASVHGSYYGTSAAAVRDLLDRHCHVLLTIDVQGGLEVKRQCPDALMIFILPPSQAVLRSRLERRSSETTRSLHIRLRNAAREVQAAGQYDYIVLNDRLKTTVAALKKIIQTEMRQRKRRTVR